MVNGALGRTRTCYLSLRRAALYPDELPGLCGVERILKKPLPVKAVHYEIVDTKGTDGSRLCIS